MASVVTAAPTDGAPPPASRKLSKPLGAAHALKVAVGKWLDPPRASFSTRGGRRERRRERGNPSPAGPSHAKGAGVIMVSSFVPKGCEFNGALNAFRTGGLVASHRLEVATQEMTPTEAIGV